MQWGRLVGNAAVVAVLSMTACGSIGKLYRYRGDDGETGDVGANLAFNVCPDLTLLFVAPQQVDVGLQISVEAEASDPDEDEVSFAWTATAGSFDDPASAQTSYNCT